MPENHAKDLSTSSVISNSATISGTPGVSAFVNSLAKVTEIPPVIPPTHTYRTLIVCFDGTGDQFDSDNSNIVELFTMLKKGDRDEQMVYYQAGIGTYTSPAVATPLAAKFSKLLDEAVAWNLDAHVMDGYEFLMQTYKANDRICIFGFSRGAYTARGLAGMIHKVGLLPAYNHQQVPFAYKMYTRTDELGWKQSNAFKKAFSVDVPIEFVGVWDTVNSVGLIPRRLPFTTSNTIVRTFRHAISLDERRAKFKANLWNRPNAQEVTLGVDGQKPVLASAPTLGHFTDLKPILLSPDADHASGNTKKQPTDAVKKRQSLGAMEIEYGGPERLTDIEEVWFTGCHCDVGGGSVDNETPHSLARIPLRWMIRECFKTNTGIMFTAEGLRRAGIDPASLHPVIKPRPPPLSVTNARIRGVPTQPLKQSFASDLVEVHKTEEEHELLDAMSPIYDQLALKLFWWSLELLPIKHRYQRSNDRWETSIGLNMGRGRIIPHQNKAKVKVHRSVKMRMEAEHEDGKKYVPKASFETALSLGNVEWVN